MEEALAPAFRGEGSAATEEPQIYMPNKHPASFFLAGRFVTLRCTSVVPCCQHTIFYDVPLSPIVLDFLR